MDPNEKIQLDDITFDDVIGGDGVETVATEEPIAPPQEDEKVEPTDDSLEDIGIENEDETKEEEVDEYEEEDEEYEEEDEDEDDDAEEGDGI